MAENINWNDVTGTAGFAYLRESMRGTLTDEKIAARNCIPTTAPDGSSHRIIAEEYFLENEDATHFKPQSPDYPGPAAHEPVKPGVMREGKKITGRLPIKLGLKKISADSPDYWGLASVMTEEEAELTNHMKVRVPETFEQVVAGCGMPAERVQQLLDDLSYKGIIEYNTARPAPTATAPTPSCCAGSRSRYAR